MVVAPHMESAQKGNQMAQPQDLPIHLPMAQPPQHSHGAEAGCSGPEEQHIMVKCGKLLCSYVIPGLFHRLVSCMTLMYVPHPFSSLCQSEYFIMNNGQLSFVPPVLVQSNSNPPFKFSICCMDVFMLNRHILTIFHGLKKRQPVCEVARGKLFSNFIFPTRPLICFQNQS